MKRLAIAAALLASSFSVHASRFVDTQLDNLYWAYNFGVQYDSMGKKKTHTSYEGDFRPDDKDTRMGYIMAAIAWQESSAGMNMQRKKGHHAYGLFQNYIVTVRTKAKRLGVYFGDDHLKYMLEHRDSSGLWAMDELRYWLEQHKGNMNLALSSYYGGWNTKAGKNYAAAVLKKEQYLRNNTLRKPNKM